MCTFTAVIRVKTSVKMICVPLFFDAFALNNECCQEYNNIIQAGPFTQVRLYRSPK